MNNQPIETGIQEIPPVEIKNQTILTKISAIIPPKIKEFINKFYANRKIFWPITITFGLLFLVVILGLIFGSKAQPAATKKTPTPTPFVQATPERCSDSDQLCLTKNRLNDFENQINSLDLKQSHLSPPQLNYDVQF